ncbi:MAG TPA: hypothetical protein QF764_12815 [Planctomycetota bacterium]|nr:hypothetical protein [Planctomycetota bacterium]
MEPLFAALRGEARGEACEEACEGSRAEGAPRPVSARALAITLAAVLAGLALWWGLA